MAHADAFSRLPLPVDTSIECINTLNFSPLNDFPINMKEIERETSQDQILSKVKTCLMEEWPNSVSDDLKLYKSKMERLSTENNCIFYANRIVIPQSLQPRILELIHENHIGMVRMKMVARSYVWWLRIDKDIENHVKSCPACQQTQSVPKEKVTTKWNPSSGPFQRVHVDFFYFAGKTFLVYVDSFSKYTDIKLMNRTHAKALEEALTSIFVILGLPSQLVSDNGPPYNSFEFKNFCHNHGIVLTHSPPYHPQSNGQGEKFVSIVKNVFKKFLLTDKEANLTQNQVIQKFLMNQNNIPSTVTGQSPNELIFAFKPKTLLDLVNPKVQKKVHFDVNENEVNSQSSSNENVIMKSPISQKNHKSNKSKTDCKMNYTKRNSNPVNKPKFNKNCSLFISESKFKTGDLVMYRNHFKSHIRWIPARVIEVISKLTYLINVNSHVRYVQENQIKLSTLSPQLHPSIVLVPNCNYTRLNSAPVIEKIKSPVSVAAKPKEMLSRKNSNRSNKRKPEFDENFNLPEKRVRRRPERYGSSSN